MVEYELTLKTPPTYARPAVVSGKPSGNVYRLPAGYQNEDLAAEPGTPPKTLGEFWPRG